MNVGAFASGLAMIAAGVHIIYSPSYIEPVFGGLVDFTGYNIPFGLALIALGAYCVWIGLTVKRNSKK